MQTVSLDMEIGYCEKAEKEIDEKAEKLQKLSKGNFDLEDFQKQLADEKVRRVKVYCL